MIDTKKLAEDLEAIKVSITEIVRVTGLSYTAVRNAKQDNPNMNMKTYNKLRTFIDDYKAKIAEL